MGNCLPAEESGRHSQERGFSGASGHSGTPRKNRPIKLEGLVWSSDFPLTKEQLMSKRVEFWDTAPAFEGRKEIWDALKAAVAALDSKDSGLAQAILDGAAVTLPTGSLEESYDELGNRYQLPLYVLSAPTNMTASEGSGVGADSAKSASSAGSSSPPGMETTLKLRLSTGKDVRVAASLVDSVATAKHKLCTVTGVEPEKQRWFFSGRALSDNMLIQDVHIPKGFVVQVVVAEST